MGPLLLYFVICSAVAVTPVSACETSCKPISTRSLQLQSHSTSSTLYCGHYHPTMAHPHVPTCLRDELSDEETRGHIVLGNGQTEPLNDKCHMEVSPISGTKRSIAGLYDNILKRHRTNLSSSTALPGDLSQRGELGWKNVGGGGSKLTCATDLGDSGALPIRSHSQDNTHARRSRSPHRTYFVHGRQDFLREHAHISGHPMHSRQDFHGEPIHTDSSSSRPGGSPKGPGMFLESHLLGQSSVQTCRVLSDKVPIASGEGIRAGENQALTSSNTSHIYSSKSSHSYLQNLGLSTSVPLASHILSTSPEAGSRKCPRTSCSMAASSEDKNMNGLKRSLETEGISDGSKQDGVSSMDTSKAPPGFDNFQAWMQRTMEKQRENSNNMMAAMNNLAGKAQVEELKVQIGETKQAITCAS
jgi:hypothetical protein